MRGARGSATTRDRLDRGSVRRCRLRIRAGLGYRISKIISKWGQLWTGPSPWSKLIGLVSDEADVNSALRGLKLIYVPYGHTCGPAESEDHARERVGSGHALSCMTTCRSHAKSTSNPAIITAINTARSQVTMLSAPMGERQ